jgi:hypothetical protein
MQRRGWSSGTPPFCSKYPVVLEFTTGGKCRAALRRQLVGADNARSLAGNGFGQNPPQLRDVARPLQPAELAAAALIAARLSLGFQLQPSPDSAARTRCQVGD